MPAGPEGSEHAEALAALADGQLQHLVQLLVGVVGGEAQLVETRTRGSEKTETLESRNIFSFFNIFS